MHYAPTAGSIDGSPVLIALKPLDGLVMGQNERLSEKDIEKINKMYCKDIVAAGEANEPVETDEENEANEAIEAVKIDEETIEEAHECDGADEETDEETDADEETDETNESDDYDEADILRVIFTRTIEWKNILELITYQIAFNNNKK